MLYLEDIDKLEIEVQKVDTLGDLQIIFDVMKRNEWTLESVEFVVGRVWWEEIEERAAARRAFDNLRAYTDNLGGS